MWADEAASRLTKKLSHITLFSQGFVNIVAAFFEFLTPHGKRAQDVQDQKSTRYKIRKIKENVGHIRVEQ